MKYILSTIFLLATFTCFGQVDTPPPPPPPPAPPQVSPEVFKVVEEMPRFPGCENLGLENRELLECSKAALLSYIADNLVYPKAVKANNITGMAVVQFTVETDGTLENIRVVRDPGSGAGEAAAAVVHKMNSDKKVWVPGKQRGRLVVVQYTLPVRFEVDK